MSRTYPWSRIFLALGLVALGCDSHGISSNGDTAGGMCFADSPCSFAYRCTSAGYEPVASKDCHSVCGPGPCSGATCAAAGPEVACSPGTRCIGQGSDDVTQLCQPVDAGTSDLTPTADVADTRPATSYADACQAVANARFTSVALLECGLGPTGISTCNWSLTFTDNSATRKVSWHRSDYVQTLSYECSGFALRASAPGSDALYAGSYDPTTGVLRWDGQDYIRFIP